jgi:hypothetical protein
VTLVLLVSHTVHVTLVIESRQAACSSPTRNSYYELVHAARAAARAAIGDRR